MESRFDRRKKKRKWLRYTIITFLVLMLLPISYTAYLYTKASDITENAQVSLDRGEKSDKREETIDPEKDNFSILFVGIDSRDGEAKGSLSDALMVATFNKTDDTVTLLSIPRDSYVDIPGHGMDKINHAHLVGGLELTVKTTEELLDIPLDYVVRGNFQAFKTAIDELGGVEIDIEDQYVVDQIAKETHGKVVLDTGKQQLDGEEALAYARTRKADSDLMRGERQMQIIQSSIGKMKSFSSVSKYDGLLESLEGNLSLNLSFNEVLSYVPYMTKVKEVDKLQLSGYDYQPGSTYYLQLDEQQLEEIRSQLKKELELEKGENKQFSS
ncbi:LCP family protein [Alkalihalobacillus sp. TS-13]|uniref:LCP family protein n=1 Tax=Alkalihalobacillus sp. TS-13 TaxID=2842455 RepID=UPI002892DBAA|nr:LCP family protein [Alkalihalobacillus sp. TS-13]